MQNDQTIDIFEDFFNVIEKLNKQARRDVIDFAVFLTWKETRKPAPWLSVIRGAWLYFAFEVEKLLRRGKEWIWSKLPLTIH